MNLLQRCAAPRLRFLANVKVTTNTSNRHDPLWCSVRWGEVMFRRKGLDGVASAAFLAIGCTICSSSGSSSNHESAGSRFKHRDVFSFRTTFGRTTHCENDKVPRLPTFRGQTAVPIAKAKQANAWKIEKKEEMMLISGTVHPALNEEISSILGVPLSKTKNSRFADGEVSVVIEENVRGRHAFILQSCAKPVNDNIMELLLTVSALRRSSASRITAVVPYFGYKHHRRGIPISPLHSSRFLSSNAMDFAKMLTVLGVDRVVAVDLQRPGQGAEACFFDNSIPLETIVTSNFLVKYFMENIPLNKDQLVVISPNSELVASARKFQKEFSKAFGGTADIKMATFYSSNPGAGPTTEIDKLSLLTDGSNKVALDGADVIIVDDLVDSAGTVCKLADRLKASGASHVYVCASHGIFSNDGMRKIDQSKIDKVVLTNTLPLPDDPSDKVVQISIGPMLADVILAEHYRQQNYDDDDISEQVRAEDF